MLLAGCARPPEPLPPPPHQGVALRIACPGPDGGAPARALRLLGRAWAARQQATLEFLPYDRARGPDTVSKADVWVLRPAELPRWAVAGKLTIAPAHESGGLLPVYRTLLRWDGKAHGVPVLGESLLAFVRADLLAAAGEERRLPATWEEYASLAERLRKHRGQPSLPPLPADDEALDRLFYTVAASYARHPIREEEKAVPGQQDDLFSFHYDLGTGRPRLTAPGFVAALTVLKKMQACRPPGPARHPEEAFLDGKAALCLAEASWIVPFQKALPGRFDLGRTPGSDHYFTYRDGTKVTPKGGHTRIPYLGWGGWVAVVPASAAHAEAAWDFLARTTGPELGGQLALEPEWGGGPIRQDQVNRERWEAFDLDPERTTALRRALSGSLAHHGLKNPALVLRLSDQAEHRRILVEQVRAALNGKVEPAKALQEASRRWRDLDERKGLAAHKAEYRLGLGLLAR